MKFKEAITIAIGLSLVLLFPFFILMVVEPQEESNINKENEILMQRRIEDRTEDYRHIRALSKELLKSQGNEAYQMKHGYWKWIPWKRKTQ